MEHAKESSIGRHFAAMGAGLAMAALTYVVGFGTPATWNGALERFDGRHPVLAIVLGSSVFILGCGPALYGARALIAPDQGSSEYSYDVSGNRAYAGSFRWTESTAGALKWLAFGWGYSIVVGFAFFFGGR